MINGIHHVQITIAPTDETAARDFYCGVLGLPEIEKPDSLKGRGGLWVQVGDRQLHIGVEDGVDRARTKAHVAYQVDDLALWRERLAAAGAVALQSIPIPGYDRFECRDPFGNRLEFIQAERHYSMTNPDPTHRFTDRAENYALYRPGYPLAVIDCLRDECGLTPHSVVADVGSGTGILTAMFLDHGNRVFAVEPNEAMRLEAERALGHDPGFTSIDGRAEATRLDAGSVDLIVAGQAFHWFDAAASRVEFGRILRPDGYVALIWNARAYQGDPFMVAYEQVLGEHGMGYHFVNHRSHDDDVDALFVNGYETRVFTHSRLIDYDTFWGGFLSSSYAPLPGDPHYEPMRQQLRHIFDIHQRDGFVTFIYNTNLYFGRL